MTENININPPKELKTIIYGQVRTMVDLLKALNKEDPITDVDEGISAQSMTSQGLSYNIGKNSNHLINIIDSNTFLEEDTYLLPRTELAAKYIAISAYNGSFSLEKLTDILGYDSYEYYKNQIEFCLSQKFITIENSRVYITEKGFKYYGAVFSLFYKPENLI